jgi:hypothetical protein
VFPEAGVKTNISLGRVQDASILSQMPLGTVRASEWLDTTGFNDVLAAPSLKHLRITGSSEVRGDFQADVQLTRNSTLASFSVAGVLSDAQIRLTGGVGTVKLGGIENSTFFAGVDELPDSKSDFKKARTIESFTVTGLEGLASAFADSQVAAARFGTSWSEA